MLLKASSTLEWVIESILGFIWSNRNNKFITDKICQQN